MKPGWDLLVVVLVAMTLRVAVVNGLGMDHWDEGAYAISARAVSHGDFRGVFERQHVLSPPMYFTTAGTLAAIFRTSSDAMLLGLSITAGVAGTAVLYLTGALWCGRVVGGMAALGLALSDFHVLYSRTALTDVLFVTLFVIALAAFTLAETRKSTWWAVLAGAASGLAWNTKYHGWLAVGIAAAAVLPLLVTGDARERKGTLVRLVIAGAVALLMFVPWLLVLERYLGGYGAVMSQHSRFLEPGEALGNIVRHWRMQLYLEGWSTKLTPLGLVAWTALVERQARRPGTVAWGVALTALAFAAGGITVLGILAVAGAVQLVRHHGWRWTPHWFALAFFAAFTVLTPLYQPYPRLLLPWLVSALILGAVALEWLLRREDAGRGRYLPLAAAAAAVALAFALAVPSMNNPRQARTQLAMAAAELDRLTSATGPIVVIGEPGLVFYLRERGRDAAAVDSPAEAAQHVPAGSPYHLVGGIYSRRIRGPASLAFFLERNPSVTEVATIPVRGVSDVRLLDDFAPAGARRYRSENRDDYDLRVYLVNNPTQ